ncbi:cell division protein FtsX [Clostridium aceticum]|uniref:Cell division protein FtsX n=1 Tax=Clostridium aceticum TaxID=84022 RepID=A0A0D8IB30_9CLOT|nr:permease-like cell division protein FtsX [Clostridium aceticum]AKL96726.1 cell division protein FtsX [Clostridium aceticum]KJF27495.1 cell-division protein [Clostridium aceticum]
MKIRTISYIFKQGFIGIWRNKGMSLASISSVAASLAVLGIIITVVMNINNLSYIAQMQFDTIQIYLEQEAAIEDIEELGGQITSMQGVQLVEYESKEDALKKLRELWGEQGYLLEVLEENTLPSSYIIHLESLEAAEDVVKALEEIQVRHELEELEVIEEIKYHKDIVDNMLNMAGFVRNIGLALIVILILVAMFIISNTIKLTLNARKQEINIMKYVGATNWFVRWPFLIEGMVLGFIGAIAALAVVYYGYQYTFELITTKFYVMLSSYVVSVDVMMNKTIPIFSVLGVGVGALGSIFSLRKHLKV